MVSLSEQSDSGQRHRHDAAAPAAGNSAQPSAQPSALPTTNGRPSKYEPRYCEELIAHGEDGLSFSAFAGKIAVSRRTLFNWAEQHAEFAEALEIAKAKACFWWEKRAKEVGSGNGGPGAASMVQFMLKNYGEADFSDRREVSYSGQIQHQLTHEQAIEEARRRGLPERVLISANPSD